MIPLQDCEVVVKILIDLSSNEGRELFQYLAGSREKNKSSTCHRLLRFITQCQKCLHPRWAFANEELLSEALSSVSLTTFFISRIQQLSSFSLPASTL